MSSLQRHAGNAAVATLVQRAVAAEPEAGAEAGNRLTSPRFTPHPILEECFQNRARLNQPTEGPAVTAVQEALIERGHNLGAAGADGKYGPATAAAVKDFKRKEGLGFEQFGDVGPGTMRRLDALFPPEPKPSGDFQPDVADEETGSCPFSPDIVTAAVNRGPDQADQPVGAPVGDNIGAGNHLDIPTAVARYKQRVNASDGGSFVHEGQTIKTDVHNQGQFFWSKQLVRVLHLEIEAIGAAGDTDAVAYSEVAMKALVALNNTGDGGPAMKEAAGIAAATSSPMKARMLALHRPARLGAGTLEQLLWSQLNNRPDASLPPLEAHRDFATMLTLKKFDKTSCGTHALLMADRIRQRGGLVPRDKSFPGFSATISAGRGVRDRRPRPPGPDTHVGDVIQQTGVLGALGLAQKALDAGMTVHARVLSGQGYGIQKGVKAEPNAQPTPLEEPPEEHSLLLIGFDASNFVFADPDANVSHEPEQGFGILHLNLANERFGTARDEGDLVVDPDGFHASRKTKRYQVISLSAV